MIDTNTLVLCQSCKIIQSIDYRFCSSCGKENIKLKEKKKIRSTEEDQTIKYLLSYSLITIALAVCLALMDDSKTLLIAYTIIFGLIDLIYAGLQPSVFKLFVIKRINPLLIIGIIFSFIFSGIIVDFLVTKINILIESYEVAYFPAEYTFEYPLIAGLFFTALFPAVFEELAFRGFIFNNLFILRGKWAAIIGSTFIFSIVHFSVISLFWLIPFGFILGYLRNKYNTIIYGMIAHFTHNATVVIIDLYF